MQELLNRCRNDIQQDLGSLDDLPKELADTVSNLYLNFHYLISDPQPYGSELLGYDLEKLHKLYIDSNLAKIRVDAAVEIIKQLRNLENNNLYNYSVVLFLDIYKYRIRKALKKSALRRRIERFFYKSKVQEIPNLSSILNPTSSN